MGSDTRLVSRAAALARAGVLSGMDPQAIWLLFEVGQVRSFGPEEVLMRQGEPSPSLHFVLSGHVRVQREGSRSARPTVLAELGPGEGVGEMGVLERLPRSASVIAVQPTETLELDAASFAEAARRHPHLYAVLARLVSRRLRRTNELVRAAGDRPVPVYSTLTASLLEDLHPRAVQALLARGVTRRFATGGVLMRQGEQSRSLFLVVSGRVSVDRSLPDLTSPVQLAELGPGEFVGEMGVLDSAPRSATATALEDAETVEIDGPTAIETLARFPDLSRELARVLSARLRGTSQLAERARGQAMESQSGA